jgi:hypothetical protein
MESPLCLGAARESSETVRKSQTTQDGLELKMRGGSDLRYAAIDEELNSRNVTRFAGGEKCDNLGDFVRIPETAA